jgi:hypothetical protein
MISASVSIASINEFDCKCIMVIYANTCWEKTELNKVWVSNNTIECSTRITYWWDMKWWYCMTVTLRVIGWSYNKN